MPSRQVPQDPVVLHGLLLEASEAQRRLRLAEAEVVRCRSILRSAVARARDYGATLQVIGAALSLTRARAKQISDAALGSGKYETKPTPLPPESRE